MDRKKVVVVGGGISGAVVAHLLESDFDVTLIDRYSLIHLGRIPVI